MVPAQAQQSAPSASLFPDPNAEMHFDPDLSRSPRLRDWSLDPIYLPPSTYIPLPEVEPTPEPQIDRVALIRISPPAPAPAPSLSPATTPPGAAVVAPVDVRPVEAPPEPEAKPIVLLPIPAPNPLPLIPPPLVPAAAPFVSGPPYLQRLSRAVPRMQVWRPGSDVPQNAVHRRGRFEPLLVTGNEPVTLLLYFHPSLAGQTLEVLADDSFTVQPPNQFLLIGPTGEAVLVLELGAAQSRGEIALRVDYITTALQFLRAPLEALLAKERAAGGTGQ